MKHKICIAAIALSSFLGACGTASKVADVVSPKKPAIEEKVAEKPVVKAKSTLKRVWDKDIGSSYGEDSKGFQLLKTSNGNIAGASRSGNVSLLSDKEGDVIWKTSVKANLLAGPGAGNGNIYVATDNGEVIALSEKQGKQLWKFQASSEVLSAPASARGIVVVRSSDGRITGLSASKGTVEWVIQKELPRLSLRGDSQTLIYDDVAVIGLPTGSLLAIELSRGAVLWDLPVTYASGANDLERINDIYSAPVIVNDILYTATYQGEVVSINIPTRERLWTKKLSTYRRLATDGNVLIAVDDKSNIIAVDAKSGIELWKNSKLLNRDIAGVYYLNGEFIVLGNSADAYSIDPNKGTIKVSHKVNSGAVVGEAIALNNGFAFLTEDGEISRYADK